jgi:large subunit ribosomal protein L22
VQARAIARHVRISPRKLRLVVDQIRGKDLDDAIGILQFSPQRGGKVLEKVIRSAAANAENNHDMHRDSLYVAAAYVDEGPTWKRLRPRARGSADRIFKRTSHVTVILEEKEE